MYQRRTTHITTAARFSPYASFLLSTTEQQHCLVDLYHCAVEAHKITLLQGFFDEDSMDEFIASETEESSMSLTSEDERMKK